MNNIIKKFLLLGDKFMNEMHFKQLGFTYSAYGPLKHKQNKTRIPKFKSTENSRYNSRNEIDKACFQHDMAYGDFKNLPDRTASDKVLRDTAFEIASNPKYDGYQ